MSEDFKVSIENTVPFSMFLYGKRNNIWFLRYIGSSVIRALLLLQMNLGALMLQFLLILIFGMLEIVVPGSDYILFYFPVVIYAIEIIIP